MSRASREYGFTELDPPGQALLMAGFLRRLTLMWALAFVAFERAYPPRDGDNRHPAEVMLAGLITPLDFLSYVLPQHPAEGTEFKCCLSWIPYPRPGRNTICPECGSEFFIRTQDTINRER